MKLSKIKITKALMWLFFALSINLFYLSVFSSFDMWDIAIVAGFFLFMIGIRYFPGIKFDYGFFVAFAILLSFTAAYGANVINGQPILLGIRPQRYYLTCWMLYFSFTALLKKGKIKPEDLFRIIQIVGYTCLVIFTIQFLLGERFMFLKVNYNYRYGTIRLYCSTIFITLLYIASLNNQIQYASLKRKYIIPISWCLLYVIFVNKGRVLTLTYLIILGFSILLWKKAASKRWFVLIIGAGLIAACLSEDMIESILSMFTGTGERNILIRSYAIVYWMNIIKDHILLGGGYVNAQYTPAVMMAGMHLNYYFVDNGFFGFIYQYGLLGATWNILLFIKIIRSGISIYKSQRNAFVLFGIAYSLIEFRGGAWISYNYNTIYIVIICVLAEYYSWNLKHNKTQTFKYTNDSKLLTGDRYE